MSDPLLDQLDTPNAEAWIPEKEGDTIGFNPIIAVTEYDSGKGYGPHTIITGRTYHDTLNPERVGEIRSLHCYDSVLAAQIAELRVAAGGKSVHRYLDWQEPKKPGGNRYKGWRTGYQPGADPLIAQLDRANEF